MGMPNEEFWYEAPRLAKAYREAQKLRDDRLNQQLWLQGLYNYDALTATLSSISFGGKQPKKHQYAKEPYDLHPHKQTPEQIRQQLVAELDAWKEAFDAKQEGEEWKLEALNTTSQLTQDDPLKR